MSRGLYVEANIRGPLDRIWELTQRPDLHQRWDLRFSTITYLPRLSEAEPQHFLYTTRIGAGLAIAGTGESIATHNSADGVRTSSLRFGSEEKLSLISEGSGYWKYIPAADNAVTFLTWYDYRTRYGLFGVALDIFFRPLIGWATAWSFDRLRLWVELECPPETVLSMTLIYTLARFIIIFIWLWHGLVPKLIFHHTDELQMLQAAGLPAVLLPFIGMAEAVIALTGIIFWRWRNYLLLTALAMVAATISVAVQSPQYLMAAFNPVTLNAAMTSLCIVAWWAWRYTAFAGRCRRRPRKEVAA